MTMGLLPEPQRQRILWVGSPVPESFRDLLERLDFEVRQDDASVVLAKEDFLSRLTAAVFVQDRAKPHVVVGNLETYGASLLDYGCLVFVLTVPQSVAIVVNTLERMGIPGTWPPPPADNPGWYKVPVNGDPPLPHARVFNRSSDVQLEGAMVPLLVAARSQPPPAGGSRSRRFSVKVEGTGALSASDRLMLRRSFYDCDELHIRRLEGARSGARVLLVHAFPAVPYLGQRKPIAFLAKICDRRRIEQEWEHYENHVQPHVPFRLAPSLALDRCALGARVGIIVGDFVADSESLIECARSERAGPAIATLFGVTLRQWHSQASVIEDRSLSDALGGVLKGHVSAARRTQAQGLGARRTTRRIMADCRRWQREPLLWGPIHGDLHGANVRVQGSDAILIDFLSFRTGPLLADPAALEVSLLVQGPSDVDFDEGAWMRVALALYQREALTLPVRMPLPSEKYAWMALCIRQVRMYALALQQRPGQYGRVIAFYLLRAAMKDRTATGPEAYRRAAAYLLTDRLLDMEWAQDASQEP